MNFVLSALEDGTLFDNGYGTLDCSPFARWVITTSATRMFVKAYTSIYNDFPQYAHLGVVNNGVYHATLECVANGYNTFDVAISPGTVELVAGLNTLRPTLIGTYPHSAYFYGSGAAPVQQTPSFSNRLLIYGDSIAVGDTTTHPTEQGWTMVLRRQYAGSVMVEAYGGRTLNNDCATSNDRTAFANRFAGYSPAKIWLAIGTNDYGLNKWTAANFGTAYADFLDKLHAALPTAEIYAQSPLTRGSEGANGVGSTLPQYRTQISTACDTRPWATFVDGTALLDNPADFAPDKLHPHIAGHAKYADGMIAYCNALPKKK